VNIEKIKSQYPDEQINALGKKDMDNIRELIEAVENLIAENTDWQVFVEELIEHNPPSDELMDEFRRLAHVAITISGNQK